VYSRELRVALPPPSDQTSHLPTHFGYHFEMQQGDIVYVGYCQQSEYKPEWKVGDEVQFCPTSPSARS
jgi:hypothetical protein